MKRMSSDLNNNQIVACSSKYLMQSKSSPKSNSGGIGGVLQEPNKDIAAEIGEGPSSHVKQAPSRVSGLQNHTQLAQSLGVSLNNTLQLSGVNILGDDSEFAVPDNDIAPASGDADGGMGSSDLLRRVSTAAKLDLAAAGGVGGDGGSGRNRGASGAGVLINKEWNDLRNVDPIAIKEEEDVLYENDDSNPWHNDNDKIISFLFGTFFLFMAIITLLWIILVSPFQIGMFIIFCYCLLATLYLIFAAMNKAYGCRVATIAFIAPLMIVILICCFFVGAAGNGMNCLLPTNTQELNGNKKRKYNHNERSVLYAMDPSKRPNSPQLPKGLKGRGWERSVDDAKEREIRWANNKGERDTPKKCVLLVGGTGVVGSSIAETLLNFEDNIELHILARNEMKAYKLICNLYNNCNKLKNNNFEMSGCSVDYYICDLSDNVSIETFMILWNKRRRNKLDILINCVATVPLKLEFSNNDIEMQFDVNVLGFVKLIDLLTPNMELSNLDCGARIVTIANKFGIMPTIVKNTQKNTKDKKNKTPDSGEWMIPTPTKREYDANDRYLESMACVRMLSSAIAMSMKLQQKYIGVYCCHPGYINSPVLAALGKAVDDGDKFECARLPVFLALAEEINVFEHSGTYWEDMKQVPCRFSQNSENVEKLWSIAKKLRKAKGSNNR